MNYVSTANLETMGKLSGTNELDSNPKFSNDPHSVTQTIRFNNTSSDFKGNGGMLKTLFTKSNIKK